MIDPLKLQLLASTRPLVIIESPYSGDIERNLLYARRAMYDSIHAWKEAPIASHLLYTQPGILDDGDPDEQNLGIALGFAWNQHAAKCIAYTDYGITPGMEAGMKFARDVLHIPAVIRGIGVNPGDADIREQTQQ